MTSLTGGSNLVKTIDKCVYWVDSGPPISWYKLYNCRQWMCEVLEAIARRTTFTSRHCLLIAWPTSFPYCPLSALLVLLLYQIVLSENVVKKGLCTFVYRNSYWMLEYSTKEISYFGLKELGVLFIWHCGEQTWGCNHTIHLSEMWRWGVHLTSHLFF